MSVSDHITRRVAVLTAVIVTAAFTAVFMALFRPLANLPESESLDLCGMDLVFFDEFDGTELDLTKWKINTMPSENGLRRAGYYTDSKDIIFVSDGALTIRSKFKRGEYGDGWYTSWVETSKETSKDIDVNEGYEGFSAVGGYFEVRAIAPPAVGIWSAFWLMPDDDTAFSGGDVQWTAGDGAEVDVMESHYIYETIPRREGVTHVLHCDGYGDKLKSSHSALYKVPGMYSEFHRYGVLWTDDEWIFYIDGRETWRTQYKYNGVVMGVSDVAEYMILSVEVGGSSKDGKPYPGQVFDANGNASAFWAGNPDKNDKNRSYDFVIDYVKVWQNAAFSN